MKTIFLPLITCLLIFVNFQDIQAQQQYISNTNDQQEFKEYVPIDTCYCYTFSMKIRWNSPFVNKVAKRKSYVPLGLQYKDIIIKSNTLEIWFFKIPLGFPQDQIKPKIEIDPDIDWEN